MEENRTRGDWGRGDPVTAALLALGSDSPSPHQTLVPSGIVELARRHGLIGALALNTSDPIVHAIDARQRARATVMMSHLRRVLELLDGESIRAAVVKGPAVANAYREPAERPYSDVDLLVEAENLDRTIELLLSDSAVLDIPEKRPKAAKRDVLVHDPSGIRFNLDLHWDLFSYTQMRGAAAGAMAEAWEGASRVESGFGPRWVLPGSFDLAFLASHAVLDHRFRLILFRDLLEIARRPVDWGELVDVTSRWGLRSTTYMALWIARHAIGASVPPNVLSDLRVGSLAIRYLETAVPRLDIARFDGHTAHPVNLASVLLNDSANERRSLLLRAPAAFPAWRRRVASEHLAVDSPRTLIVVSTDRRRGAEVFTERLRAGLTRRGWVVEAVALAGSGTLPRADVEPLTNPIADTHRRFDRHVLKALRAKIKAYRPDLVVANGGATLRYSLVAKLGLGPKVAYMGIGEPEYWIRSKISRWANKLMLRMVDVVLTVSEETRQQLIRLEPRVETKSHTVFTGLEPQVTKLTRPDSQGPLRVLVLGSLTSEKDPIMALEAVAPVEEALVRFVGDGPLTSTVRSNAERLGMANRVELVGAVEEVGSHLEWAHVLLLTSTTEGLPGAVLEASAAGLAIVAVDVGGVREAVKEGLTGIVTSRRVGDLSKALVELDSDRGRLEAMGEAGRSHVRENFLIDDIVRRYETVLRQV